MGGGREIDCIQVRLVFHMLHSLILSVTSMAIETINGHEEHWDGLVSWIVPACWCARCCLVSSDKQYPCTLFANSALCVASKQRFVCMWSLSRCHCGICHTNDLLCKQHQHTATRYTPRTLKVHPVIVRVHIRISSFSSLLHLCLLHSSSSGAGVQDDFT